MQLPAIGPARCFAKLDRTDGETISDRPLTLGFFFFGHELPHDMA
jgi:hypothetical protein